VEEIGGKINSLDSLCFFLADGVIGNPNALGLNVPNLPFLPDDKGARFGLGGLTEL